MTITCFMAAICRDKVEGGDGTKYFGSLGSFNSHVNEAKRYGLLTEGEDLTDLGTAIGEACRDIPTGRSYYYSNQYEERASAVTSNNRNTGE